MSQASNVCWQRDWLPAGQMTAVRIAEQMGISRRRFFDWMNALKAGGLAGLLERQHGGGAVPQVRGQALKELQRPRADR